MDGPLAAANAPVNPWAGVLKTELSKECRGAWA
jgi:hypothetical protein